jgi:hypothetical protein
MILYYKKKKPLQHLPFLLNNSILNNNEMFLENPTRKSDNSYFYLWFPQHTFAVKGVLSGWSLEFPQEQRRISVKGNGK